MQTRTSLLASAAVGVLLAIATGAAADAKTTKHHAKAAEAPVSETAQQIRGLTAEIEELKARLDAQSSAVSAAQSEAASARAEAQAAHQQVETQIQTIPGEVQTAVAAKVKPSWADNTQVTGRVYADISNIHLSPANVTSNTATSSTNANGTGVDIKRAYLGVDHKFNEI
jgi:outer membrane murein-binding lipoprotein Lpp